MPLTLGQACDALQDYAQEDRLPGRINRAVERLINHGKFKGLKRRANLTAEYGVLELPSPYTAILALKIDDAIYAMATQWYDFIRGRRCGDLWRICEDLGYDAETGVRSYQIDYIADIAEKAVVALCKVGHVECVEDDDLLSITNLSAIKLGLQALHCEDEHDNQRADDFWNKAVMILNRELAETMPDSPIDVPRITYNNGTGLDIITMQ